MASPIIQSIVDSPVECGYARASSHHTPARAGNDRNSDQCREIASTGTGVIVSIFKESRATLAIRTIAVELDLAAW